MTKKSRRIAKARRALLSLSLVLVVAFAAVGGTVAWLTASTTEIVNAFTVGDINIILEEDEGTIVNEKHQFKMVPGNTIAKDPIVTVKANSEACYLFVKVTESADLTDYITYAVDVDGGWTPYPNEAGIYYRAVAATTADVPFNILSTNDDYADGYVTVNNSVDKDMMAAVTNGTATVELSFVACAVQSDNLALADAWTEAEKIFDEML